MPYKFNGKEFDQETGLYYYGARYMNPVTSLWYGVDPLAEKYSNSGGYVYCVDNPIILHDIDGKEWKIHTSKGKDGKINVSINITGVILNNSSNKKIDMSKLRDKIKQQIISRFNFSSKKYNVKTNIDLRNVQSVESINENDHVFELVDQNILGSPKILASSVLGGLHIRIGPRAVAGLLNGTNTRTIPHEVGHSGGLPDANIDNRENVTIQRY